MIQKLNDTVISNSGPELQVPQKPCESYSIQQSLSEELQDHETPFTTSQIGWWTKVTNDADLAKHLLDLYFTWSHSFYVLFLEDLFYHGLHDKKLKYATPLLVNAVLAVGCLYSELPATRTNSNDFRTSGDHFFAEAKMLLATEREPSLTTIAAVGVMSIWQSMKGYTSIGMEYAWQMMTMSTEMNLHMDPISLESFKDITMPEIEARRVTFWGAYAIETAFTMCLGRISGLPRISVRVEKPYPNHLESKPWKPLGHSQFVSSWQKLEQPSFTYSLARQLGYLTDIVNDTGHLIHAPLGVTAERKLLQLYQRYQAWLLAMPPQLHIKESPDPTLPQVIALQ